MRWTRMFLVTLGALFAVVPAASANTYRVTGLDDDPNAFCFADVCDSLRAAVTAAGSPGGPHAITLPAGTIQLTQGVVQLGVPVTITGAGADQTTIRASQSGGRVLEINSTTVELNALALQGGVANFNNGYHGGSLRAQTSTVTLNRVRVSGGLADSGGGIANRNGTMVINESLVDNNFATQGGGDGGGIINFGGDSGGPAHLTINHSTVAFNTARMAGGVVSYGNPQDTVSTTGVTIAQNRAGDRWQQGGGGISVGEGVWTADSTLVGDNFHDQTASNCTGVAATSTGGNVEGGAECGFTHATDRRTVGDLRLATQLEANGGPTPTLALLADSPALNVRTTGCGGVDQRGVSRPQGPGCDAGAFESGTPPVAITSPAPGTVTEAATIELRGTAGPSEPVTVYRNGVLLLQTIANGAGAWAISVPVEPGEQTFEVETPGSPRASVRVVRNVPAQQTPTPVPTATPTVTPVVNRTIVVEEERGTVKVKVPGSNRYLDLNDVRGIPVGSTLDTRKGRVRLTSIPKAGAPAETAVFYDGIFKVTQSRGITNLTLTEPLAKCPKKGRASAAAKKAKKRKLWGDGKGSFRTTGKYSAATVRGTKWLVEDSCAGTLTRVTQGVVVVKAGKVTKTLRAGKRYLARPR